jgi:hypothetical protein
MYAQFIVQNVELFPKLAITMSIIILFFRSKACLQAEQKNFYALLCRGAMTEHDRKQRKLFKRYIDKSMEPRDASRIKPLEAFLSDRPLSSMIIGKCPHYTAGISFHPLQIHSGVHIQAH